MKVSVRYIGFIKDLAGRNREDLEIKEDASILDVLNQIDLVYGKELGVGILENGLNDVKMGFMVAINGILIGQLDGLKTRLHDGDDITLMSLTSGG